MGLIKCNDCKKDVSDTSLICVHCGNTIISYKRFIGDIIATIILALLFLYNLQTITKYTFELFDGGNEIVPYIKEGNVGYAVRYTLNQDFLINKNIKTCYVNMYSLYSGYKNKMVFRTTYPDVKVYEGNSFEFAKNGGATSYDQLTYVLRNIDQYSEAAKLYFAPTSDSSRDVYYRVLCTTNNTSY